jgi:signal transduction histidine kinase
MTDHRSHTGLCRPDGQSGPMATLDDVDITAELNARPPGAPNYAGEDRAFGALAQEIVERPRNMLQMLAEVAIDLCGADTAGVSVLDGDVFRWEAVAGVFAHARGGTMPRHASPCGICIDRDATQLMHLPDRCFPVLPTEPRFVEALLIPFHHRGKPMGAVWIASHGAGKRFHKGDERNVRTLARFVSVGWELWTKGEAAAEASRRKDTFLAVLGHELRNPFAAITAATAVLRQRVTGDDSASRAIEVIARQCLHTTHLADDLLEVARLGTGKVQLEKQRLDLRTIVLGTLEARRTQIERRQQHVTISLGAEPVWVDADPIRLTQVVSNLIDNAAKYTPERGHISVGITSGAREVSVEVHDTGMGVAADQLASIFEPFTQLRESRNLSDGGLGLGLAVVRSLTELHGGTVDARSAGPGQGSSFTIRLPLFMPAMPPSENRAARVQSPEQRIS